ncbi:MAG: hypothetical protein IIB00_08300 [candidate division Zixibacteria bacterium]|nr:hypothetical protein [candidate division Zixibacteria bacterium]
MPQVKRKKIKKSKGATIIEVLIALTLIFIVVTVGLRLQSSLASKLGTRQLEYVISAADSIMVEIIKDSTLLDENLTFFLSERSIQGRIKIDTSNAMRRIRVILRDSASSKQIHTLYYEEEIDN